MNSVSGRDLPRVWTELTSVPGVWVKFVPDIRPKKRAYGIVGDLYFRKGVLTEKMTVREWDCNTARFLFYDRMDAYIDNLVERYADSLKPLCHCGETTEEVCGPGACAFTEAGCVRGCCP